MIKPLLGIELTSSKARSGMASASELIPRLIRSYELQAELMQRRESASSTYHRHAAAGDRGELAESWPAPALLQPVVTSATLTQTTFGWS